MNTELNRRNFMRRTALSALALSLPFTGKARVSIPLMPALAGGTKMGIVVHSYATRWDPNVTSAKYPGFANAIDLMRHAHAIGAAGIQVGVNNWTPAFTKQVRAEKDKLGIYLEASMGVPYTKADVQNFENNVVAARTAGIDIIRTVCTSGRRYEVYHTASDFTNAHQKAMTALELAEPVLRKHKARLGVENHKDWRADELAAMIKKLSSEWIGVTLDFGNSIALMEDPMEVVNTLAPFAVSTHVKDMGLDEYDDGLLLSEVPLGTGMLDLNTIVATCKKHNPKITFNLEMITRDPLQIPCLTDDYWSTFAEVSGKDLAHALRMVKKYRAKNGLPHVSQLSTEKKLGVEERNVLDCLEYSAAHMGMRE